MSDGFANNQNGLTSLQQRIAELEIQLQQTQEEWARVQQANVELMDMINSVGDVFFGVDENWCFRHVNLYGAHLAGMSSQDLIGKNLWECFPQLLGTVYETYYRQAMAEQKQVTFQSISASSSRWFEVIVYPSEHGLVVYGREISKRKVAENALREREQDFTTLANSIPQLAWMTDATGWIFWYNQRWYEYTGTTLAEVEGWGWQKVHHPQHVNRVVARIKKAFDTGEPWEDIFPLRGKNGQYRWFPSRALPIYDDAGRIIRWFGTNTDITERKQHEAERERLLGELAEERAQLQELTATLERRVQERTHQVQALAARLSLAEHQERKRVSQILHDHVQQMLYGVQWRTYMIEAEIKNGNLAGSEAHLAEMKRLITEAVQAARTLTVELSPPVLENEGLPEAVAWLANQMEELYALTVEIETHGDCQVMNKNLRVLLFQIIRELLFNVVKHAKAEYATVTLRQEDEQIIVTVGDGGAGFDTTILAEGGSQKRGLGLFSIRERLDLFAGRLEIVSTPGNGTAVTVILPISSKSETISSSLYSE